MSPAALAASSEEVPASSTETAPDEQGETTTTKDSKRAENKDEEKDEEKAPPAPTPEPDDPEADPPKAKPKQGGDEQVTPAEKDTKALEDIKDDAVDEGIKGDTAAKDAENAGDPKKGDTVSSDKDKDKSGATAKKRAGKSKPRNSKKKKRGPRKAKACKYRTPLHRHVVRPGEIVGGIAGTYGVTVDDLRRLNPRDLRNPDRIFPGTVLVVCPEIPPRERLRIDYLVEKGDTFSEIAKKHEITQNELWRFQQGKLKDRAKLRIGRKLAIWVYGDEIGGFSSAESDKGFLKKSHLLKSHRSYFIKRPKRAYGTKATVLAVESAMKNYHHKYAGPRVVMGDLSRHGGGPLPGHVSHQTGKDVDLGYIFAGSKSKTKNFISAKKSNLDVRRTWGLIHQFLKTGKIRYIFMEYDVQELLYHEAKKRGIAEGQLDQWFQYPRGKRRSYGIIRHWRNHHDHVHIRFR